MGMECNEKPELLLAASKAKPWEEYRRQSAGGVEGVGSWGLGQGQGQGQAPTGGLVYFCPLLICSFPARFMYVRGPDTNIDRIA